jgi:hypothetical protein
LEDKLSWLGRVNRINDVAFLGWDQIGSLQSLPDSLLRVLADTR